MQLNEVFETDLIQISHFQKLRLFTLIVLKRRLFKRYIKKGVLNLDVIFVPNIGRDRCISVVLPSTLVRETLSCALLV